jgi:hypothetical protein
MTAGAMFFPGTMLNQLSLGAVRPLSRRR